MPTAVDRSLPDPRPPGLPWPDGLTTVTIRPGDPCPYCGQTEAHTIRFGGTSDGLECEPGEVAESAADAAWASLFGLHQALELCDEPVPPRLLAKVEQLEQLAAQGQPRHHDGLYRGRPL